MSEHATTGTADLSTPVARWGILGTGFIAGLQTPDLIDNGSVVQAVGSRTLASATGVRGPVSDPHVPWKLRGPRG